MFCLSAKKSRDIARDKILRGLFWTKSRNKWKLCSICISFESTYSMDFKNIHFIEIEYLDQKLANLCNFICQNDQFWFQKSNMVTWHIKLTLKVQKTFCNYFWPRTRTDRQCYARKSFFSKLLPMMSL